MQFSSMLRRPHPFTVLLQIFCIMLSSSPLVYAEDPTGGNVVAGAAAISARAGITDINQFSTRAVIDWNSFSVGASSQVNFNVPGATAATLNRVTGGSMSSIAGQINSNGSVYLVNPQGVVFNSGASINVGALTASTLDVGNSSFMNGGTMTFNGSSTAGVHNYGSIQANHGDVNFFGADVSNHGQINASTGTVNMAAGSSVTVDTHGGVIVNDAKGPVSVLNTGVVQGGRVMLSAGAGHQAVSSGIENATMVVESGGRVYLASPNAATNPGGSVVEIAGGSSINASGGSSSNVTMTGGAISVEQTEITTASGGQVNIGDINETRTTEVVDATIQANGPGGSIRVLGKDLSTAVGSTLNAENAEVSSHGTVVVRNLTANGHLYIDPVDVVVGPLTAGSILVHTENGGNGTSTGLGRGNIAVEGDLKATTGSIELLAHNDIYIGAYSLTTNGGDVIITGDADLTVPPYNSAVSPDGIGAVFLDGTDVFSNGGDVHISGFGHNDQGTSFFGGLVNSGVGVTLQSTTIDTRPGAEIGSPLQVGAGGITITGTGNLQSRGTAGDIGGNIGVLISNASSLIGGGKVNTLHDANNDIVITGFGGGVPDSDILSAVDPFQAFNNKYANENHGVVIQGGSTIELVYGLTNSGSNFVPVQDGITDGPGHDDPELHIFGQGGNGLRYNTGVSITGNSVVAANDGDLVITGIGGGLPDSLATAMIADHLGSDPVGDFSDLYGGIRNLGVAISSGSTVRLNFELPTVGADAANRRRFDDIALNNTPADNDPFQVDPMLLITGKGGTGTLENIGVVFDQADQVLASDAHVTITGIGGGVSAAGMEALIMNTNLNDGIAGGGINGSGDYLNVSNQDVIDAISRSLGSANAGIGIFDSVIAMGMSRTPASVAGDLPVGDGRPNDESTGRLTLNGFGGVGKYTNDGVRIQGDGAGISVESGDLYVNAYGGGTYIDSALHSNYYGSGNEGVIFSPRNTDDADADHLYPQLVQAFDLNGVGGIPDLNSTATLDLILDANPNAVDFITRDIEDMFVNADLNDRVVINNLLERDLTADELNTLGNLFGDENHGLAVEGQGAFIEGTSVANLYLDGHGGVGKNENHGVYLSGLGASFTAAAGNDINPDGIRNVNDLYNIHGEEVDNNLSRNGIAGVNINGVGGGIPSIIVQGMISNASKLEFVDPDNPQFAGIGDDANDHAIAPAAVVDNDELITAIFGASHGVYGDSNNGVHATGIGVTIGSVAADSIPRSADLITDITLPGAMNSDITDQFNLVEVSQYLNANPNYLDTLSAAELQTLQSEIAALEIPGTLGEGPAGNVAIVGQGGYGKSNNMGVHVTGLGATIQADKGNIDVFAYGGGVPDDVLAIDQASNGIVTNIDQGIGATNPEGTTNYLHIQVDKLFERDMDGADLATLANGQSAIYGDNNRGFLLEGLGAQVVSQYVEPSFIAGDAETEPIRDNNGYFLNGRYDGDGTFIPVLPGGYSDAAVTNNLDDKSVLDHLGDNSGDSAGNLTRHPDGRHLQIVGAGGTGSNANKGVEINGLGAKVETDSADIHIEGEAGGVSTIVANSLIENAKDTFFDVPEGTTDRTDLFYGGFENVSGPGLDAVARVAEDDLTPGDRNRTVIGNGFHVAADTRDVIQALDALYGDNNEGVVVTGLGAKVHAKTGIPGQRILPDPATTTVEVPVGLIVTVDRTDYNPGDMISLADLANAASVTGAPATPITTDHVGEGGAIDAAIAAGAQADQDAASADAVGEAAATFNNSFAGAIAQANGDVAIAAGQQAVVDGEAAVAAAVTDAETQTEGFTTALAVFISAVEAASEPTTTPGTDAATTAGNVFITGTGGYGESTNNGIRIEGLGAKVQADLGNIHMDGFGGGLPEGIFVIQGDGHVEGGFAGSFGPSEYETTVSAASRNYRTDRLFEVDFDVNDWDFLVAPAGRAPNRETSDGLYGDGNQGIIVTGLGAAVISNFKEPAALRAFFRPQDSSRGNGTDAETLAFYKFAHSYLSPSATGNPDAAAFDLYNGYNDSQETGQGDAAWIGVDGNDNLLGNGIVGHSSTDFQFLDSPVTQGVNTMGPFSVPNVTGTANGNQHQDTINGNINHEAVANGGTSLDVIAGGLSGFDATNKGELVLVDDGNFGVQAYTIARGDGELLDVDGVTQNLPTGVGGFTGSGDNFGNTTFKVGVNDNARLTTDGQGNLINTNHLVDGPGAGYQRGIAVLQKRDVELNGVGGFGRSDNLGVRIDGLGAKVTSLAASIDIEGFGGGIQSNVIRSAIENFADVTPVILPDGVGTDRIADFSADRVRVTIAPQVDSPIYAWGEPDGIADLDQLKPGTVRWVTRPDQLADHLVGQVYPADLRRAANRLAANANASPELLDNFLEVPLTSDQIMGGSDAGGTQGLVNWYGDNNQGVLVTGLGAKVEATLTSADLWAAINGDTEARNPLGTNGSEQFNYTFGDPNYTELLLGEGVFVDHPLARTREASLAVLETAPFMDLTGNLNNRTIEELQSADAIVPTFSGDGANFTDPARGTFNADANIVGSITDSGIVTAELTFNDLTNESTAVTRAAIAEASDTIIVTARESRANVSIIGHGGTGKNDNYGVHFLGLGTKAVAGTALTGKDAGNLLVDGVGGGIPSGLNGVYGVGDNVVAIDHPQNFITDKLLEADFSDTALGSPTYGLPALFGDKNMGVELNGLGAKFESQFAEPFVAIAPINPSIDASAETLGSALAINEHQPDPLRSYVHMEENSFADGVNIGLPMVASRDVQIIGDGGSGSNENKGVFVTGLGAKIQSNSADISVLGNTRQTSGIPDAVVQSMIENASEVIWDIPHSDAEDRDRIPNRVAVTNDDLIVAMAMIYGDDNRGVHVTGLGTKIQSTDADVSAFSSNFDDPAKLDTSVSYVSPFGQENFGNSAGTGNVTIIGNGGRGRNANIGVEQSGLGTKLQSGVGNITILASGGGVPNEVLVIDGAEGSPLASRNYLVDKLFERDLNSDDIGEIKFIFGSDNEGFVLNGLGAKVQSDYVETAAGSGAIGGTSSLVNSPWLENFIRDLDGNFLTGDYTLGHNDSAEMFSETGSNSTNLAVSGEHPLARRVSIVGNGGTGIDRNKGIRVQGLGAKVQSESADITLLGNQLAYTGVDGNFVITGQSAVTPGEANIGGMQHAVIRSLIENAKDTAPIRDGNGNLLSDRTDGVFGNFVTTTTIETAVSAADNGFAFAATSSIDTDENSRRYSDGTLAGEGVHVAATNASVMSALKNLYGDENIGVQVEGLGAKVHSKEALFGGNIDIAGTGGPGEAMNFGVKVEGLGIKVQADHGSIHITGFAGGQPSEVLTINGNGRIDRLFEADFDLADLTQFSTTSLLYGDDNIGVRIKGLAAKVQSNFKEPPALRAFTDPETGDTKYAFAYDNPFAVATDFHGQPKNFDDYDSPNGSDQVSGGTGMLNNGRADGTDKGTLVLTNGDTSNGRLLVPNTFGELEVNGQSFALNDNANIGGDAAVDGVPVIQQREVNVTGTGGNGQSTNDGVQVQGLGAKVASMAADITIDGQAGGIPSDVINSLMENIADVTPAAGRDRTADFDDSGFNGNHFAADMDLDGNGIVDVLDANYSLLLMPAMPIDDDLLQVAGGALGIPPSADLLDAMVALYGNGNRGVLVEGLAAKIQATLTPEQLPQHSTDVAADLGTTGAETIFLGSERTLQELPALSPGFLSGLSDEQRAQGTRDIAEAADTILLTGQISRANVTIQGEGGTGKHNNMGVHVIGVAAKVIADHATAGDAGNIDIDGLGGGIPMDVLQIGSNGLTDTLLETDMSPTDIVADLPALFGDNNHGVRFQRLGSGVESTFREPFVASAITNSANTAVVNDDLHGAVYVDGSGQPLVAWRTIEIDGTANATIDGVDHVGINDNKGVFFNRLGTHVTSDSSNILIEGHGGGAPDAFLHNLITNGNDAAVAGTDRINNGMANTNDDIIDAVAALYGDRNKGIEFSSLGAKVESTDTRLSAPNSLVGNIAMVGHAGTGTTDNIGVEVNGLAATVRSSVGNVLVEGFGGGPSTAVTANSEGIVDSINELSMLTPTQIRKLGPVGGDYYGNTNHGVRVAGLGATVESRFDEPGIGDIPGKAYSYRGNNVRNPFFINTLGLAKTDSAGFIRALKTDLDGGRLGLQGNGILRDDLVAGIGKAGEGREVVIAGIAGPGVNQNKGVFFDGRGAQATSVDVDVDIDGAAGGIPDGLVAILNATHIGADFDASIAALYGTQNHGVEFKGDGAGTMISDEGTLEVNGTGGQGFAENKGILITRLNVWEVAQGDIVMVGTGGGIYEPFNAEYDASANPGDRVDNHGIEISGASTVTSLFDVDNNDDLYETETTGLLSLDGQVGNNQGLGNDEVGEIRDLTSNDYDHDLGAMSLDGMPRMTPVVDDVGILVDEASTVKTTDADIDLFANLDLLVRGSSQVITSKDGDIAAVATRHLEVSGSSLVSSSGTKANGDPTQTTIAWDQNAEQGDALSDTLGRLKVDASSGIGTGRQAGELRLYGNRRGPDPQPLGTNIELPHPTVGNEHAGYSNEIDAGATFNGRTWTDAESDTPQTNSGDHATEFYTWEQEQWGTSFDLANRRALTDSDRFNVNQAPSAYNFGNPGAYTADMTFFYKGSATLPITYLPILFELPFNFHREAGWKAPLTYSEMLQSVFPSRAAMNYGPYRAAATGGNLGNAQFNAAADAPWSVSSDGAAGTAELFGSIDELVATFATRPAGIYQICPTGSDQETSCIAYLHDPSSANWRETLLGLLGTTIQP